VYACLCMVMLACFETCKLCIAYTPFHVFCCPSQVFSHSCQLSLLPYRGSDRAHGARAGNEYKIKRYRSHGGYFHLFLGVFSKLRKTTISFVISVLLSLCLSARPCVRPPMWNTRNLFWDFHQI